MDLKRERKRFKVLTLRAFLKTASKRVRELSWQEEAAGYYGTSAAPAAAASTVPSLSLSKIRWIRERVDAWAASDELAVKKRAKKAKVAAPEEEGQVRAGAAAGAGSSAA